MTAEILFDIRNRVGTITLNRPDRMNALTATMLAQLREVVAEAGQNDEVRALVVIGAGRGFCAGVDLDQLAAAAKRDENRTIAKPAEMSDAELEAGHSFNFLLRCPKPVICAINGGTAGVGFALPLCCDLRYVAQGARLTAIFPRRGLPAEHASAWLLPKLIGVMNALDLLLSGRTIDAAEAERLGLARMLPAEGFADAVHERARALAADCSPLSMATIKRQVLAGYTQTLEEATRMAAIEAVRSHATADFKEGVAHYLEKRPADFPGR